MIAMATSGPVSAGKSPMTPPSAHLVGICGAGMKALAELLGGLGWRVCGSDRQPASTVLAALRRRGLRVHTGHAAEHLSADIDLLVYSPAVPADNVERRQATEWGIPQRSFSQMLGELMAGRIGVSVAGTHGKSTTTAMLATVLEEAGREPSVVIGAELLGRERSGWAGEGSLFVVESCEYRRSFLDLAPGYAVVLGIEPDHFDCYRSLSELQSAFAEFVAGVPSDGLVLARGDCPVTRAACSEVSASLRTFGRSPESDWWASDVRRTVAGSRFRMFHGERFLVEISLEVPGRHNVDNALAAAALAAELGLDARSIRNGLAAYRGIRRRFETVTNWRGVTVVDDYAHHPTAVRATLATARERFGSRRIWCAFQPHQISRTRSLVDDFATSFDDADEVLVVPVYAVREDGTAADAIAAELAGRIGARGRHCRFEPSLDRLRATLENETRPGDVLITMGAGDIDRVQHEFTR